jgi:hypothetical protein
MVTLKLKDVFVPGGMPSHTYQERTDEENKPIDLENKLKSAINRLRKFISVAGHTKCGKTVLVRKVIPLNSGVWIEGAHITSIADFWTEVQSKIGLSTATSISQGKSNEEASEEENLASFKPGGMGAEMKNKSALKESTSSVETKEFITSSAHQALNGLQESQKPLIIDDFHYISSEVQTSIIRGLKQAVFDGLTVILILIPHRMHQAATAEMDVEGRTHTLPIPKWRDVELFSIAEKGFRALNVRVNAVTIDLLVRESFESPHLMQDFCSLMCDDWTISEVYKGPLKTLDFHQGRDDFFQRFAADAVNPETFLALRKGPERTNRIERSLKNGGTCDTYEAVLMALKNLDVMTPISWTDLRKGLQNVLIDEPQQHEVTRVLEKMDEIAKERNGEPVIDYLKVRRELHLVDPFFRFYVRWGSLTIDES